MELALIIDFGTTNMKAGVVDPQGRILAHSNKRVTIQKPEKGAAEHNPDELFDTFIELTREVTADYRNDITVLALSGYQFGFMPMSKDDKPLTGMITLLDTRSKPVMNDIENRFPVDAIYDKTGCPSLYTYIFSRLIWLQQEKPDLFKKSAWFADIKSYFIHRLCGQKVTEPSIASVTRLFNIHNLDWDDELLNMAGIERSQLPVVVSGTEIVGTVSKEIADKIGIGTTVSVIPGLYDGGSLIMGMGGYNNELGIINLGTTAMFRGSSDQPIMDDSRKQRLQTYALFPGRWAIGGAINNAGFTYQWFKENFAGELDFQELNELAAEVPAGSEGLFCLPFLVGERDPRIGNQAAGTFFGLKDYHQLRHFSRAVMEGVGYSLNLVKEASGENGVTFSGLRIGGSGGKSEVWLQILADILNIPIRKSLSASPTLVGAAIMAHTAIGLHENLETATKNMVEIGPPITPNEKNVAVYQSGFGFYKRLVEKLHELYAIHAGEFV